MTTKPRFLVATANPDTPTRWVPIGQAGTLVEALAVAKVHTPRLDDWPVAVLDTWDDYAVVGSGAKAA